ncbi:MAG: phosphotransferase family protein [Chloroflexota bacterium]
MATDKQPRPTPHADAADPPAGGTTMPAEAAQDYLHATGVLPEPEEVVVEELRGGVSSQVLKAESGEHCVVLKQALPKLRVADDWQARPERALVEARAAAVLARLLPAGAVLAPLHVDAEQHLFVMPCAPAGAETWKAKLLRGELRQATSRRVGELLGLLHARSRAEPALASEFADRQYFLSLRVEPYLDTVAARRPELAAAIARHRERLLATRECLVHGDYSPKNLLVTPHSPAAVILLDHEVAHWGDPSFDLAFCLTHLHAKAVAFPERAAGYLALAATFWQAYLAAAAPAAPATLERHTVGLLGCLLAARVDGKSPVEYLIEERQKEAARALASKILLAELRSLTAVAAETKRLLSL